ncbi:MAG: hypothetical protein J3R72DRAFT_459061 [Linnemannia gamsii]|nr:MAG: hypothetical protein J3R72DRAFT_459061 [Linnemannia gamsii]
MEKPLASKAMDRRRQQHHIPTEILLLFGELLDGISLCASLRVCRQWHLSLSRLIWAKFTKQQWQHPSYPINLWTRLVAPFQSKDDEKRANRILAYLQYIRSFEWGDYTHPIYPFSRTRSSRWGALTPFPDLGLFRCMPNLVRFSLVIALYGPLEYALLSILNRTNFPNLHVLVLDLPARPSTTAIEKLYDLFSTLEELELRGSWYHGSMSDLDQSLPSAGEQEQEQEKKSWMLKRLTVDRVLVPFLPQCSGLEQLSIQPPKKMASGYMSPHQRQCLSRHIQRMSNLKVITIGGTTHERAYGRSENRVQQPVALEQLWKRTTTTTTTLNITTTVAIHTENEDTKVGNLQSVLDHLYW